MNCGIIPSPHEHFYLAQQAAVQWEKILLQASHRAQKKEKPQIGPFPEFSQEHSCFLVLFVVFKGKKGE